MKGEQSIWDKGGAWVATQMALMAMCFGLGWWQAGNWSGGWYVIFSGVLLAAGAWFAISGVAALGRNRTIFPEPVEGGILIEHGIYSLVRHPLYTSVMMLSLSWACWCQSISALCCALVMIGFLTAKARSEENRLLKRFPSYADYMKRTERFLPWLF